MDEKFKPLTATPIVDPSKHVNYSYGMVLGVDDFTQEFVYHSERDQWMTRDIDGYGTVSGLRVTLAENANGEREVIVSAGTAVNPRGQMICVPAAQCAVIDRWLAVEANRKGAEKKAAESPGAPLGLYVVLCYRDCPTDKVPVPGEPCRSEDETVANSRLKDDFRLELRLTPPAQAEELAVREFVRWLREHVEFTDEAGGPGDLDPLVEALRGYAEAAYPSSPPDYAEDSPPFVLKVPSDLRCDFLRAAFRVWVTEVRPRFRPDLPGAHCSPCAGGEGAAQGGDEDCVLLAELRVFLTPDTLVDDAREVRLVEAQRPVLVPQRMLQEFLLCGSCCAGEHTHGDTVPVVSSPPDGPPGGGAPPPVVGDDTLISELVTVTVRGTTRQTFWLLFHLDPDERGVRIRSFGEGSAKVQVEVEGDGGVSSTRTIDIWGALQRTRLSNAFVLELDQDVRTTGFTFDLGRISLERTSRERMQVVERIGTLSDYARERDIRYIGQRGSIVTMYASLRFTPKREVQQP